MDRRVIRSAARRAAYRCGALPAHHRWRNRRTLTVIMLHRVLPAQETERREADPTYTITTQLFDEILVFLRHHYRLVELGDVLAARTHRKALPARALLVTFDDGWRDNLEHALPILRRRGAPAALFAASEAMGQSSQCWWQDVLLWTLRTGRRSFDALWHDADGSERQRNTRTEPQLSLLVRFGGLDPARRDEILRPFAQELEAKQPSRQMLEGADLPGLAASGVAVGAHGALHLPLTIINDPEADLVEAQRRIGAYMEKTRIDSLSFPHGRYDDRVVAAARDAAFKLLFTSDAVINPCPEGWVETDLIGRIALTASDIVGSTGHLSPDRLAAWLFLRPVRRLGGRFAVEA